jgi:hypothetical protein
MRQIGMKNKCKFIKKDGHKCNNYTITGSEYCYIHSIINSKQIPLLHNPITHISLAILLCIVGITFSYYLDKNGPSKDDQNQVIASQNIIIESQKKNEQMLQNIMRNSYDRMQVEFLKQFPMGYTIFSIDYKNSVFPYENNNQLGYNVDWSKARIIENSDTRTVIQLPDIESKAGSVKNIIIAGSRSELTKYYNGAFAGDLMVLGKIIETNQRGIVCIMGLAKNPD